MAKNTPKQKSNPLITWLITWRSTTMAGWAAVWQGTLYLRERLPAHSTHISDLAQTTWQALRLQTQGSTWKTPSRNPLCSCKGEPQTDAAHGDWETLPYWRGLICFCWSMARQKDGLAGSSFHIWRQQSSASAEFPGQGQLGPPALHGGQMLLTLPAWRKSAERRASQTADCRPATTPGSHHIL